MTTTTTTTTPAAVRLDHVSKDFGRGTDTVHAVRDVSLDVAPGSIQGIIGWSGAGKSTLVRTVNGLETPTSGEVWVEGHRVSALGGRELRALKKRTAMVFQHFNLLETSTVVDNVAMPLLLDGVAAGDRRTRALRALDFVGLTDRAQAHPGELSGGQKQRVGIARALVRDPAVLLCDEATSALDPATTGAIVELLRRVNEELGTTVVVVTHEMDVIKDLCDHVAVMEDGRIVESGTVLDLFISPRHPTTERFVETVVPRRPPLGLSVEGDTGEVWRLVYTGEGAGRPLLSALARDLDLEVNILAATITEIHAAPVGHLVVRVGGETPALARGLAALRAEGVHVDVEEAS